MCAWPSRGGAVRVNAAATRPATTRSSSGPRPRPCTVRAPHVAMATIAADAGVGIGTLYRHFRNREDLLRFLTHRSFEQVLANVQAAERRRHDSHRRAAAVHRSRDHPAQRTRPAAARRAAGHGPGNPRGARPDPPRPATDHRTRPCRRHDQARRESARCRRLRGDARSAAASRSGMGRDLPAVAWHLPQWPESVLMACRLSTGWLAACRRR